MKFKSSYESLAEAKASADVLKTLLPKYQGKYGTNTLCSVLPTLLGNGSFCITISISAARIKQFEKHFAEDRIRILDHSLGHQEVIYKKNLREAQMYIRTGNFIIRNQGKFKYLCQRDDYNGSIEIKMTKLQKEIMKLRRQVRLQNKFISAMRKIENA